MRKRVKAKVNGYVRRAVVMLIIDDKTQEVEELEEILEVDDMEDIEIKEILD